MCTLTFFPFPQRGDFILTVNRDESSERPAIAPQLYRKGNSELYYPKDPEKGGTWIGLSSQRRVINLMNGAFKKHERHEPYRKSRGLIVLDLLTTQNFMAGCKTYDLENIEPFTLVAVDFSDGQKIYEFRWDGERRYLEEKPWNFQVWSASMTYDEAQKIKRREFFKHHLHTNPEKNGSAEKIWNLHHARKDRGDALDLIIDRGELKTTSISQVVKRRGQIDFKFDDLLSGTQNAEQIKFSV